MVEAVHGGIVSHLRMCWKSDVCCVGLEEIRLLTVVEFHQPNLILWC
jgi:hypothetical protein